MLKELLDGKAAISPAILCPPPLSKSNLLPANGEEAPLLLQIVASLAHLRDLDINN